MIVVSPRTPPTPSSRLRSTRPTEREITMSDTASTQTMACPKCAGAMRTYERSGITIDQCTECRGVFLDRGELERLIDAESAAYSGPPASAGGRDDEQAKDEEEEGGSKRRRRGGFLGDLFEFGD